MSNITKLSPLNTVSMRGFDGFGAAAFIHSASDSGFTVSGVFRDQSDFAVLVLYDTDDFYEHPRNKYLPDPDLSNLTLSFDLDFTNLQPIDSPKFPTIDWPYLDVARWDGSSAQIPLWSHAALAGGTYTAAQAVFNISTSGAAAVEYDRLTLWFQNIAFDYEAAGGETAAELATILAGQINGTDWNAIGGLNALLATTANAQLTVTFARYGTVNTNGHSVTLTGGQQFTGLAAGDAITIGSTVTTVVTPGNTTLQVANDLGVQTGASYLAARGGYDGNMVTMYAQPKGTIAVDVAIAPFSGGSSSATWTITLDFTALGIDSVRQMWLTLAPQMPAGAAYAAQNWDAVFSNWTISGSGSSALHVAGPGSVRMEETDSWCSFKGTGWASTANGGFYSKGFAMASAHNGDSVTIEYTCQVEHDLWIGTAVYSNYGQVSVSVDGDAATILDTYCNVLAPVVTRRQVRSGLAVGQHTCTITLSGQNESSGGNAFYLDFLEAVVAGDVPDPLPALSYTSPALDFDTDSTYKLSPQRLLATFDNLGLAGPMNEYVGVFWALERVADTTGIVPALQVRIGGVWNTGDALIIYVGGEPAGKTVFPQDTNLSIAQHLAYFANEVFSGVWAAASSNSDGSATLTLTSRSGSSAYNFTFSIDPNPGGTNTGTGTAAYTGSLSGGQLPNYLVNDQAANALNYGARQWHADLFSEVAARGWTITCSFSMEFVFPPDDPSSGAVWAQRFPDGTIVATSTGFADLVSIQCSFTSHVLAFQQKAFLEMAGLQAAAGLIPELQMGEFSWWYYSHDSGAPDSSGMAFYDQETAAAANLQLSRPLSLISSPDSDPTGPLQPDAAFLAERLFSFCQQLSDSLLVTFSNCLLEWLWPYDANSPFPIGLDEIGGRFIHYVNTPSNLTDPSTSLFARVKIECLDADLTTRSLDEARLAMAFFPGMGWPISRLRYLYGLSNGGAPWQYVQQAARGALYPYLTPFAYDHVQLFGWDLRAQLTPGTQLI